MVQLQRHKDTVRIISLNPGEYHVIQALLAYAITTGDGNFRGPRGAEQYRADLAKAARKFCVFGISEIIRMEEEAHS